jgi:ABC-type branched-subunit amino acid transport system substrate-binding protein
MFKKYFKIIKPYNKLLIFFIIIFIITYLLHRYVESKMSVQGIAENKIVFGQSLPLTKSNYHLGIPYSLGYYLAFQNINRKGGINNYKLELLVYDDQYDPKKTIENINILVNKSSVFGITTVGTQTSTAVSDFLYEKNVPFLQPLTGSNLLRSVFKKNTIFTLPSYYNEMQITLDFLYKKNKKNISVIYQNDDFGLSMMNDINDVLNSDKYGNSFNIISTSSYELKGILLNNIFAKILDVNNPYNQEEIKKSKNVDKIEVLILLSTSKVVIESIQYFKQLNPKYYIMIFSFQDIANLIKVHNIEDKYLNNIYTTQLIPNSDDVNKNIINTIKNEINFTKERLLKKKDDYLFIYDTYLEEENISTILIEGYLNGLFIIEILKGIKNNITRDNFINEIYKRKIINVMGFKFGPYVDFDSCTEEMKKIENCPCNAGLRTVYLYKYDIIKKNFVYTGFKLDNLKCALKD